MQRVIALLNQPKAIQDLVDRSIISVLQLEAQVEIRRAVLFWQQAFAEFLA